MIKFNVKLDRQSIADSLIYGPWNNDNIIICVVVVPQVHGTLWSIKLFIEHYNVTDFYIFKRSEKRLTEK